MTMLKGDDLVKTPTDCRGNTEIQHITALNHRQANFLRCRQNKLALAALTSYKSVFSFSQLFCTINEFVYNINAGARIPKQRFYPSGIWCVVIGGYHVEPSVISGGLSGIQ